MVVRTQWRNTLALQKEGRLRIDSRILAELYDSLCTAERIGKGHFHALATSGDDGTAQKRQQR